MVPDLPSSTRLIIRTKIADSLSIVTITSIGSVRSSELQSQQGILAPFSCRYRLIDVCLHRYHRFAKYFRYEEANPGQDAISEHEAEDAKSQ